MNKLVLTFLFSATISSLSFAQCTGCTSTISSSTASGITIGSGQKVCIVATSGNITISGNIRLEKNGTLEVCTGTNDTVKFNGAWGEPSPGGSDRWFVNSGNVQMNMNDAGIGWRPFRSIITNSGHIAIKYSTEWYDGLTNSGTITIGGNLALMTGSNITNSGTITSTGNFNASSSSIFSNSGTWNIGGDAPLNGDYTNSGRFNVGGTLTINAAGVVNIQGGIFYSTNLVLNSGVVHAGTGCAAFIVTGYTDINSNTFLVGSGVADITDLSTPGNVDANTCPAGPPVNCGLTFSASTSSNSCLSTLPVSLLSFTGKYLNDSKVELQWVTSNEENNLQFVVDRTEDLITYHPVSYINGTNKSNEKTTYTIIDENADSDSDVFYRLRHKDIDGSMHDLRIIMPDRPDGEFTVDIYPNPNKGQFKVTCRGEHEIRHIHILDQTGKIVYQVEDFTHDIDKVFDLDLAGLKGMYILSVATNEDIIYTKIDIE